MNCKYCNKECKNLNSLRQHEVRCAKNPHRKAANNFKKYIESIKGKTKDNCPHIAKQAATLKQKYADGYTNPSKGKHNLIQSIYQEHNDLEINKWLQYIKNIRVETSPYQTTFHNQGYKIISKGQTRDGNTIRLLFEHDYLMEQLLNRKLTNENVVHHIDKNRSNNNINNLMLFKTKEAHKRFHASKRAYLIYDATTHEFDCINK